MGSWFGPRADLNPVQHTRISCSYRKENFALPVHSPSLYWLSYSGCHRTIVYFSKVSTFVKLICHFVNSNRKRKNIGLFYLLADMPSWEINSCSITQKSPNLYGVCAYTFSLRFTGWKVWVRFSTCERDFSLIHKVRTDFETHPAPCSVGTWGKAAEVWSWPLISIVPKSRLVELYLQSPYIFMS
jgi:hypothetical protein